MTNQSKELRENAEKLMLAADRLVALGRVDLAEDAAQAALDASEKADALDDEARAAMRAWLAEKALAAGDDPLSLRARCRRLGL